MNLLVSVRRDIESTGAAGLALFALFVSVFLNRYRVEFVPLAPQIEHFAVILAFGVFAWLVIQKRARLSFQASDLLLLAYLALALGSALLFPPDPRDSVQYWGRMVLAVAVYFATRWLLTATDANVFFRLAVKVLLLFGVLEALFGIVGWFAYPFGINLGVDQYPLGVRGPGGVLCNFSLTMYGTLWEPNVFGSTLATIILIGMTLFVSRDFSTWRKPLGIGIAIMLVALALNASRGALGALALGCAVIFFFVGGMSLTAKLKWLVAAAALCAIVYVPSLEVSRDMMQLPTAPGLAARAPCAAWIAAGMPRGTTPGDPEFDPDTGPEAGSNAVNRLLEGQTLTSRWVTYKKAWDDFLKRPILGNGPNSFGQIYTTTAHTSGWISNMFLMALHDTGILGVVILLAWLVWYPLTIFFAWRSAPPSKQRTLVLALGIGLFGLLVTYQVTTMLWFGFVWWYFAFLGVGAMVLTPADRLRMTPATAI